jgi:hypothetical protein
MFQVTHLANGRVTILENQADFTRGKFNMGIFPLFGDQLTIRPCTSDDLSSLSQFQLDVVNQCTRRNISEGKGIPGFDIRCGTRNYPVPCLQLGRREDIPFLSVDIVEQGNPSGSIGIVLN